MRSCLWLVLLCLLPACSSHTVRAPVGDRSQKPVSTPAYHTVRQGDTLYSVAFLYGQTVEELAAWNRLRTPYTIYKGQQLRLSPPPVKKLVKSRPKPAAQPRKAVPKASQPKPRYPSAPGIEKQVPAPAPPARTAATQQTQALSSKRVYWSWPVTGRLIRRYDPNSTGKKGIDIAGKSGQPVRAAAAGKVVYSGSGLTGYGRLIIIKHNKDFLSAYAHNRKLIAKEGQWVKKGEVIAQMGNSGTDRIQLHFEIRKKGRPVDPLRYLPKR